MHASPSSLGSLSFLLFGLTVTAQCAPQWQAGEPAASVRGTVSTTVNWDPDGTGPLLPRLVVGGSFAVGSVGLARVAAFDGSQWTTLGTPPSPVSRLCDWNGLLVAACSGFGGDSLFAWTGAAWLPLGAVAGSVQAMGVYSGSLYVGGSFSSVGGVPANGIARSSGTGWSPVGSGTVGVVRTMAVFNNLLYVGGTFTAVGGVAVGNMAAWNGGTWLPTAAFNGPVEALGVRTALALSQNQLFAAGSFTSVGSTPAKLRLSTILFSLPSNRS